QGGRPLTESVRKLPAVRSAESLTFVFGGFAPSSPEAPSVEASALAGSIRSAGAHLIAGRLPDPTAPGEFVADTRFRDATGASLGDHFSLVTLTQQQADATGFATDHPEGPTIDATLVGQIASPADLSDPTPGAIFSPSLIDDANIGISATIMAVGL